MSKNYNKEAHKAESKFLSLVLRHKPQVAGIALDEHGWADVDELVKGVSKTQNFSHTILEEIVTTDSKNRYSFNEDYSRIRANQGHSINVDLGLVKKTPPDVLYHGTAKRFLDSILKQGIIANGRLHVHLSDCVETAMHVGERHGRPAVLRVDSLKMAQEGIAFYLSENGVWLTKEVPVKYISVFKVDSRATETCVQALENG